MFRVLFLALLCLSTAAVLAADTPSLPAVADAGGVWKIILSTAPQSAVALIAVLATHAFAQHRARKAQDDELQGVLRALYVEAHHRAARVAADANTWRKIVETIKADRKSRLEAVSNRNPEHHRYPNNLPKFTPVPADVYRQLGGKLGHLPKEVQAPLSMFHFRLEMVARDVERFSRLDFGTPISDRVSVQLAARLWDACGPALDTLRALEKLIEDGQALTAELDKAMQAANYPVPGQDLMSALRDHRAADRPQIPGVQEHLA